jgi:hypothetical protein
MKLTKENVCVFIDNEAQLKEARKMLEKHGEKIATDGTFSLSSDLKWQYIRFDFGNWWLADRCRFNEITIQQLEEILKQSK